MKLKKIIAREFLFFLSISSFIGIIFIGIKIYNSSRQARIESTEIELSSVQTNYQKFLSKPLKVKNNIINQTFLNRIVKFYELNNNVNKNLIYKRFPELNGDSVLLKATFDYLATIKSNKYNSLKEVNLKFPEFFIINQVDDNSLNNYKSQIELLQNKINEYNNSIYTKSEILKLLYTVFIYLLVVLFGMRYFYYSTKWVVKKSKTVIDYIIYSLQI
jgi:hypothetical protein